MKTDDELNSVSPQSRLYYVGSSAVLSECGNYRYELSRIWDTTKPMVMFLMLNPSTADANKDDNTIRRCIAYAKSWGYGGVFVGNLFAYRATNPKELLNVKNPVGEKNQSHLIKMSSKTDMTICAWGNSPIVEKLSKSLGYFKPLSGLQNRFNYLELSKNGTPKHPLYLKCNLLPIKYEIPSRSLS